MDIPNRYMIRPWRHRPVLVDLVHQITPRSPGDAIVGAEIGVASGRTSACILEMCPQVKWHMVDVWVNRGAFDTTLNNIHPWRDRAFLFRMRSEIAFKEFTPGYFDIVFIDAQHNYESVKQDLNCWWPTVRKGGGIFCGHDYTSHKNRIGVYGVDRAVQEFSEKVGIPFRVDEEGGMWIMET